MYYEWGGSVFFLFLFSLDGVILWLLRFHSNANVKNLLGSVHIEGFKNSIGFHCQRQHQCTAIYA